ncbi:hypothetical protein [Streptomyces spiralis]
MAADSAALPNGWRNEYENHPEYQAILARMEKPWWKRPAAMVGGVVAVAVASFCLGVASVDSGGSDQMAPAEKGRSDAQWMVRNHTQGGDVSITGTSPEVACEIAEKGVGFIRFYSAEQSQEYLTACEQELAALIGQ